MDKNHFSTIYLLILLLLISPISIPEVKAESEHQGVISLTFDDNYDNQYNYAWSSMQERGITGTFFIRTGTMETSGYMAYWQLQLLQNAGNEIASHSVTHRSFTELTDTEIRSECQNSKNTLSSYGLSISNFAYPNGLTNNHIDEIVDDYYNSGRTAYISPYIITDPTNQFRLPGYSSENETNELESLKNIIDQVYSSNSWAIILFHNIIPNDYTSPYTTSQEDFEALLDYIISKNVRTLTVDQALNTMIPLTINTNLGTTSPNNGLYELETTINIEAFPPTPIVDERFIWMGWTGSGNGSYTGVNNPVEITLNQPIQQSATWKRQYKINIHQNGIKSDYLGNIVTIDGIDYPADTSLWLDQGLHSFAFIEELFVNEEKKYLWISSAGMTTQSLGSLLVSGPGIIIANYQSHYYVNITSSYGQTEGEGWYGEGSEVRAIINDSIIEETEGVRHIFLGWSGDGSGNEQISNPMIVNRPLSVIVQWQKQYLLKFSQIGILESDNVTIRINSKNQSLPASQWFNEGIEVFVEYPEKIIIDFLTTYTLDPSINQSISRVDSPLDFIGIYNKNINLDTFIIIIVIGTIIALIILIIFMKKKDLI